MLSSLFAGLGNVVQSYLLSKIIDGILNTIPFKVIVIGKHYILKGSPVGWAHSVV